MYFKRHIRNKSLTILKEKNNIDQLESLALRDICKNKNLVFRNTDKDSTTVIMYKKHYLVEGCQQLNNNTHYCKEIPLFIQISVKFAEILNRLRHSGVITENNYNLYYQQLRLYMLIKIYKAFNS